MRIQWKIHRKLTIVMVSSGKNKLFEIFVPKMRRTSVLIEIIELNEVFLFV